MYMEVMEATALKMRQTEEKEAKATQQAIMPARPAPESKFANSLKRAEPLSEKATRQQHALSPKEQMRACKHGVPGHHYKSSSSDALRD